ncbi:MAG: hypothetical protein K2H93_00250 [Oscillospiraceae bacterium]|nr:hypothetical protein [Oscillospiraceae bacterium]
MKIKKYLASLIAVLMMGMAATACNKAEKEPETLSDNSDNIVHDAPETSPEIAGISDADIPEEEEFEPAYTAEEGQAYLAIAGSQWDVQYWGSAKQSGYMLAYDAGIADIKGDGSYTVSVNANTKGFRNAMTGNPNETYTPEGIDFMAVMIPNGESLYPNAVITIDSILVDGNEIELTAKNYTSTEDGTDTRATVYNTWVNNPPKDARTSDGALYDEDGDALSVCKEYSAQIFEEENFATWTKVEVNFTITGTNNSSTPVMTDSDNENADEDEESA